MPVMASNNDIIDLLESSDGEGDDSAQNAAPTATANSTVKRKAERSVKGEEASKRHNTGRKDPEAAVASGRAEAAVTSANNNDAHKTAKKEAREKDRKATTAAKHPAQEIIEIESDDESYNAQMEAAIAASLQLSSLANNATASHSAPQEQKIAAAKATSSNVWVDKNDKGSISKDILSAIQLLARNAQGGNGRTARFFVTQCGPVTHFQQSDQWSCGFRNVQMLLSALVPKLTDRRHPYYASLQDVYQQAENVLAVESPPLVLPSLEQLQQQLEECWGEGFDPKGSAHFGGKVLGKKSLIGAVEVSFLLRYWSMDTCVIQCIRHDSSRELLPLLVYRYFQRQQQRQMPNWFLSQSTHDIASDCVEWAEQERRRAPAHRVGSSRDAMIPAANYDVMPLYLQWEGHSVTIVGIEPTASHWKDWNLLVLDPLKKGSHYNSNSTSTGDGPGGFTVHQDAVLKPFRRSCRKIAKKDSQIVMVGTNIIPLEERNLNKEATIYVTADAVAALSVPSLPGYI